MTQHDNETFTHGKSYIQAWADDEGLTAIHAEYDGKSQSAYLSNDDVPAFALAVLKAAGHGGEGDFVLVNSINTAVACLEKHIENIEREAEIAARDKRRDEVTRELAPEAFAANNPQFYKDQSVVSKRAIDRIIELEQATS